MLKVIDNIWNFIKSKLKDILYIAVVVALLVYGYKLYLNLTSKIEAGNVAYKQLSETLARAQNESVTKAELLDLAKSLQLDIGAIKKDLSSLDAKLVAVGTTVAKINSKIENSKPSDNTVPVDPPEQPAQCKLCDIFEYTANKQLIDVEFGEMPFASVEFDARQRAPWTIASDAVDVKVDTAIGEREKDGTLVLYHTISLENKSRPELAGKDFKLKIASSKFSQLLDNRKEFYTWSPHLELHLDNNFIADDGLSYKPGVSAKLSLMSYGLTKNDSDWRFVILGLGVGFESSLYGTFGLFEYNIGKHIPLLSNLYIGINGVYNGNWGFGINIGASL